MYYIRVCASCHNFPVPVLVAVTGCVCVLAIYPAHIPKQQSDCLLALFQSPFLLTPTQLSTRVSLSFFFVRKMVPNLSSSSLAATLSYALIYH